MTSFPQEVERKSRRRARARRNRRDSVWFGLGTVGLVGWSVVLPTVAGVFLGVWLDRQLPGRASWTLMLLALGVMVGCGLAWHWVSREREAALEEGDDE